MIRPILALLPALACAVDVEAAKLATPDAMPVDQGSIEVSLGLSLAHARKTYDEDGSRQERGGDLDELTLEAAATYGIRDGLDAGITVGWARVDDAAADPDSGSGPTDVVLGAKWQVFANDTAAIALLPELSLPVGDGHPEDEISTGSEKVWNAGLTLATTITIDRLALGAGLGRAWVLGDDNQRGDARGAWAVDLAAGWQLTESLQPEIELHHVREVNTGDSDDACLTSVTLGIQCTCAAGRLGLGLDRAIAGRYADQTTTLLAQAVTSF